MLELILYSVLLVISLAVCFFSANQVYLAFTKESQNEINKVLCRNGIFVKHGMTQDGDGVKATRNLID